MNEEVTCPKCTESFAAHPTCPCCGHVFDRALRLEDLQYIPPVPFSPTGRMPSQPRVQVLVVDKTARELHDVFALLTPMPVPEQRMLHDVFMVGWSPPGATSHDEAHDLRLSKAKRDRSRLYAFFEKLAKRSRR